MTTQPFIHLLRRSLLILGLGTVLFAADPPEATITQPATNPTIWEGVAMTFAATSSPSGSPDIYTVNSYTWNFGDGTANGSGASTSHAFPTAGTMKTYTVTLTVNYTAKTCTRQDTNGNCTAYSTVTSTKTATRTVTVWPKPVITSFSAASTSVRSGTTATLNWATTNASSLSLSGVGTVTGTSATVTPTGTTTYTLTATNPGGSVSASVTVSTYTVTVSISPGTASLKRGESQVFTGSVSPANQGLSWSTTGGTLNGSTFSATASGTFSVKVTSVEDPTQSATATVVVAPVVVATPSPAITTILKGTNQTFACSVSGAVDTNVTWSTGAGASITSGGLFTSNTLGTYTVTATSTADPTKSASTTITVASLLVTINPSSPNVRVGKTLALSATVDGPNNPSQAVTWQVLSGGGSIDANGLFTAPATTGTTTVKATAVDGSYRTANVTISLPQLSWVKDIVYIGTKEVGEVDQTGLHVTQVDHLGSPRFMTGPTGALEAQEKFLPYGEALADQISAGKFAKGFTNHEQTDASGLIYMQARFYAPWFGRFLSPDPARDQHFEETQSWNIYSYVQNDPTMHIDPNGMAMSGPGDWRPVPGVKNYWVRYDKAQPGGNDSDHAHFGKGKDPGSSNFKEFDRRVDENGGQRPDGGEKIDRSPRGDVPEKAVDGAKETKKWKDFFGKGDKGKQEQAAGEKESADSKASEFSRSLTNALPALDAVTGGKASEVLTGAAFGLDFASRLNGAVKRLPSPALPGGAGAANPQAGAAGAGISVGAAAATGAAIARTVLFAL